MTTTTFSGSLLVSNNGIDATFPVPLLTTTVPLSFWGGIDPLSGVICDATHPLHGYSVADSIFCLPSGRGSCTASQVLLELILNKKAPKAIVLRDVDGLVCVGALVALEIFPHAREQVPQIICLGTEEYNKLMAKQLEATEVSYGTVTSDGTLVVGNSLEEVALSYDPSESQKDVKEPLSEEEVSMLESATSEAERMALSVLIRYAHIVSTGPVTYLDIDCAHIDGCTYIGPGGLEFCQRLVQAQGRVKVPTTLNSGSCDRQQWKHYGVPQDYAHAAVALGDAYLALNCQSSFTCAPYLLVDDDTTLKGRDICWGESNAVVFANSVLGARTEKYADYLDICAALVGKTVAAGVHLPEKRRPQIILDATAVLKEIQEISNHSDDIELDSLFPVLGHLCGTLSDGLVPLLLGFDSNWDVSKDQLKAFCAAFGTTGTSPLIHIANITPEVHCEALVSEYVESCQRPIVTVPVQDLMNTFHTLDSSRDCEFIDLVALGNPHLSISECETLSELVANKKKHDSVRIMACMSRSLKDSVDTFHLQQFGVEFIHDTCWCMLLDPPVIPTRPGSTILTNSGKYAHYGPGLTHRNYRFGSLERVRQLFCWALFPS